ncbi:MAG: hypothetical protein WDN25_14050 [Acetobacteraceae bacterium]
MSGDAGSHLSAFEALYDDRDLRRIARRLHEDGIVTLGQLAGIGRSDLAALASRENVIKIEQVLTAFGLRLAP